MNFSKNIENSTESYRPKYPVQTLEKAIKIIDFLKNHPSANGASLSEISQGVNMQISGVHRILDTLFAYNYVERGDNSTHYKLGWELFNIGKNIPLQHTIANIKYIPLLENICGKYNETVNLGILNNYEVVVLNKVEPNNPDMRLTASIQIGGRGSLYIMGMGKLFLSDMTDEEISEYYRSHKIEKMARRTITSADEMIKEAKKIRQQGYATEMEEFCEGLGCVSTPIRDYTGKIVAAISISGAVSNLRPERLEQILPDMKETCRKISFSLGYVD